VVNLKFLLAAGAALLCSGAFAQGLTSQSSNDLSYKYPVWVNAGLFSYHKDRNQGYRESNWGLGFETMFTREHGMVAGTFLNSEHARSKYIGYQWRPLSWSVGDGWNVAAGLSVNAIDGYPGTNNRGWFIAPLPILALEYKNFGANFVAIPHKNGGAVAVQFKLRVW
jgi:hypothetical protein